MTKGYTFGITLLLSLLFLGEIHSQKISASYFRSYAVCGNGGLSSFGNNLYGTLGDSSETDRLLPVSVRDLTDVVAVASGEIHAAALKKDGTVWAWGNNNYNQLGDSTGTQRTAPVKVKNMSDITQIAVRNALNSTSAATYALKSDGTVWSVGGNEMGQFGILGTMVAVKHPALSGITMIAAGGSNSFLALKDDGTIWSAKAKLTIISDVAYIACGSTHNLAIKKDGTVWAWGTNNAGQLGDSTKKNSTTPVQVKHISNVVAVKGGSAFSMALKADGTVWAWGSNDTKQLGVPLNVYTTPIQVPGVSDIVEISAGSTHAMAVKRDGTLYTWGGNFYGQLGNNTKTDQYQPVMPALSCGSVVTEFNDAAFESMFALYPNPTSGSFVLDMDKDYDASYSIEIVDNLGVKVETSMAVEGNKIQVDAETLRPGLYTVLIRNAAKTFKKKLIIQ
jgi:alpha-tubulin suppressor-like RCC1 family protein